MGALAPGDVVTISAVDRLSRDTTDLLVIAHDMQCAGRAFVRWSDRLRWMTIRSVDSSKASLARRSQWPSVNAPSPAGT